MQALGIDIGTTTISAVILNCSNGAVLRRITIQNDSTVLRKEPNEKCQDADRIWSIVASLFEEAEQQYGPFTSIGVTGQMHGIVYVDANGTCVSPLYTWQDESGNQISPNGKTYAQWLNDLTGMPVSSGFGITTLFCHSANKQIPSEAKQLCTIGDYIVMKLAERRRPIITPSNAAGIGCYFPKENRFNLEAIKNAGMNCGLLPEISSGYGIAGKTRKGVPVSLAIGDNQSSVIGSVKDFERSVLVNIGTASQISMGICSEHVKMDGNDFELRPCVPGIDIMVGAPLCGGRAYAALEAFFRETVNMAGIHLNNDLYAQMEAAGKADHSEPVHILTHFCGTRQKPYERGAISNIGLENFTPGAFVKGMLYGIAQELFVLYQKMLSTKSDMPDVLVGSGNGIRRNSYMKEIIEQIFSMKMQIPVHEEEAAFGAALYSLVSAGYHTTMEEAQRIIQYLERKANE